MKSVSRIALLALGLILILGVSGCKKRPVGLTHIPGNQAILPQGEDVTPVDPFGQRPEPAVPKDLESITGIGDGNGTILGTDNIGTDILTPLPPVGTGTGEDLIPGTTTEGIIPQEGLNESFENFIMDKDALALSTIYFDLDRSSVRSSERDKAEEVALYLMSQKQNSVLVDGHCDNRGTEEYNRALGERRALSVREYLVNVGIAPDRIHTRSLGEDLPALDTETDAAYTQNRRAEFILLIPKN